MLTLLLALAAAQPAPVEQLAPVGQTIAADLKYEVKSARRVGQNVAVDYTVRNVGSRPAAAFIAASPVIVDPKARRYRSGQEVDEATAKPKPVEIAKAEPEVIAPGAVLNQTAVFRIEGPAMAASIYNTSPKIINESTWFFVIGGQRLPFAF